MVVSKQYHNEKARSTFGTGVRQESVVSCQLSVLSLFFKKLVWLGKPGAPR